MECPCEQPWVTGWAYCTILRAVVTEVLHSSALFSIWLQHQQRWPVREKEITQTFATKMSIWPTAAFLDIIFSRRILQNMLSHGTYQSNSYDHVLNTCPVDLTDRWLCVCLVVFVLNISQKSIMIICYSTVSI